MGRSVRAFTTASDGVSPLVHRKPPFLRRQVAQLIGEVQRYLYGAHDVLGAGEQYLRRGVDLLMVGRRHVHHRNAHGVDAGELQQRQGDAVVGDGAVDAR